MQTLVQDLRYGARMLFKNPGFTSIAVLTLALGIGANTAIFSIINAVLLRPLPFPESERLVSLGEWNAEKGRLSVVSPRNLEDWERRSQTIEHFGAWRDWRFAVTTPDGPALVSSGIATPGLFAALGVRPELGRTFQPEEDQPGRNRVALISHSYWQSHFGGNVDVIGQSLLLDQASFTVIGVLPREMEALGMGFDIWAPVSVDPDQFLRRSMRNRRVYARLKPGATLEQARAEMGLIGRQLAEQYPQDNAGWAITIKPLLEEQAGSARPALRILFGSVALVLLIACANVACLMLVRAAARRKEFTVRVALGAGRGRVIRQLLTESMLLSALGGIFGMLLAFWLVDLFKTIGADLPRIGEVQLDSRVFAFTTALSLLTGALFGLAPGWQSARINLVECLKEGERGSQQGAGALLRGYLVVSQIALALVLLVGAGLLGQSFIRLATLQPGFNPEHLLTVQLFPPLEKYPQKEQVIAFYRRVTEEFKSIPGVQSVGASSAGPQFGGFEPVELLSEGQPAPSSGVYPQARYYNIGPDYFHTMQIPIPQGREFNDQDDSSAPPRAIINETLARRFWPQANPIGQRLQLVREQQSVEIIGVVGDVRRFGIGETIEPEIYFPLTQRPRWASYFIFRTSGDPLALVPALRARVASVGKDVVVVRPRTLDQLIAASLRRPRFNLILIGMFAATALILAAVGLYGAIAYSTRQRTREIGIRIALGARKSDVLRLIVSQGLRLALIGISMGIIASLALTRLMQGLLFGVSANDSLTLTVVSLLLLAVALLAGYLPARRATKVDPMVALRYE